MQTSVEETDSHVVRLTVEVPPEEFARDLDRAYRKVAGHVKIPGFRKGKVPKKVIDARVGRAHVLEQFVHDAVPSYYVRALREHDLAPITDPEIDLDRLEEGKPLRFTATVEVRPRLILEPERYRGVEVQAPSTEPRELEVDEYLDHLRERFAELEVVERPAQKGDYVLADVRATLHGTELPEVSRVGFLTEVGSAELVPELDRELEGAGGTGRDHAGRGAHRAGMGRAPVPVGRQGACHPGRDRRPRPGGGGQGGRYHCDPGGHGSRDQGTGGGNGPRPEGCAQNPGAVRSGRITGR